MIPFIFSIISPKNTFSFSIQFGWQLLTKKKKKKTLDSYRFWIKPRHRLLPTKIFAITLNTCFYLVGILQIFYLFFLFLFNFFLVSFCCPLTNNIYVSWKLEIIKMRFKPLSASVIAKLIAKNITNLCGLTGRKERKQTALEARRMLAQPDKHCVE